MRGAISVVLVFGILCLLGIGAEKTRNLPASGSSFQTNIIKYSALRDEDGQTTLNQPSDGRMLDHKEAYWPCPNATAIIPCICIVIDEYATLDMDCSNVASDEELEQVFKAYIPFNNFRNLIITPAAPIPFNTFTMTTFGEVYFINVTIINTALKVIEDGTFANSEDTLFALNLPNNQINTFPFESLANFLNLTVLNLNNNKLTAVNGIESISLRELYLSENFDLDFTSGLFKNCPALELLDISHCGIPRLEINMFESLLSIHEVYMSNNTLELLLPSAITPPGPTLTLLDLSMNPLHDLAQGAIGGLAPTAQIWMEGTLIVHVCEEVWSAIITDLGEQSIKLTDNPLRCGCDMAWLYASSSNLYGKFTDTTTCSDGYLIYDIPEEVFLAHCQDYLGCYAAV